MEPNSLMRILQWLLEGKDAPAKLFLVLAALFIVAEIVMVVAR